MWLLRFIFTAEIFLLFKDEDRFCSLMKYTHSHTHTSLHSHAHAHAPTPKEIGTRAHALSHILWLTRNATQPKL